MSKLLSLPVAFLILLLCSCTTDVCIVMNYDRKLNDSTTTIQIPPDFSRISIIIASNTDSIQSFYLTPTSADFKNYTTLVNSIVTPDMSEREKAIRLWKFASTWSSLGVPPARNAEVCNPLKLFNSFGYALCGGRNGALANLYQLAGLRSRVYNLEGHIVSEVFFNRGWHMFDADREIYFTDGKGEIASVQYISSHPEIIESAKNQLRSWGNRTLSSRMLQRVYSTTANNRVNNWFMNSDFDYKNELNLRGGDRISYVISRQTTLEKIKGLIGKHAMTQLSSSGILERKSSVELSKNKEVVIKENSPYVITRIDLETENSGLNKMAIYYSPDSVKWYFKGIMPGNISFTATNTKNEKGGFKYYLKIKSSIVYSTEDRIVFLQNYFLFSDKLFVNADNSCRLVLLNRHGEERNNLNLSGVYCLNPANP